MNPYKEKLGIFLMKNLDQISSCKALYDKFDEQRREIKAEKAKRIRELTDPDHAWGADHDKPR